MMQHGAAAELLARLPLLRGIGDELLAAIQNIGVPQRFAAHDILGTAGLPAEEAFVILEGQVALYSEDGRQFGEPLGPGKTICEMAMIVETRHYFSAIAVGDGLALSIARDSLGQFMRKCPWLATDLAKNIGRGLAETATMLHELDDMLHPSEMEMLEVESGARPDLVIALEEGGATSVESGRKRNLPMIDGTSIEKAKYVAGGQARQAQARDLLSDLGEVISHSDRTRPERAHDQTASPNRALRQSRVEKPPYDREPVSPKYDQADGPDLMRASHGRGSSTM